MERHKDRVMWQSSCHLPLMVALGSVRLLKLHRIGCFWLQSCVFCVSGYEFPWWGFYYGSMEFRGVRKRIGLHLEDFNSTANMCINGWTGRVQGVPVPMCVWLCVCQWLTLLFKLLTVGPSLTQCFWRRRWRHRPTCAQFSDDLSNLTPDLTLDPHIARKVTRYSTWPSAEMPCSEGLHCTCSVGLQPRTDCMRTFNSLGSQWQNFPGDLSAVWVRSRCSNKRTLRNLPLPQPLVRFFYVLPHLHKMLGKKKPSEKKLYSIMWCEMTWVFVLR